MSRNKGNYRQASYEKGTSAGSGRNRSAYVYGNTVRKPDIRRQLEEPDTGLQKVPVRRHQRAHHMTVGYVVFLIAALVVSGYILVSFIQLQAELTNRTRAVAAKERELNNLRITNDEEYNRIVSSINLEEIKRIAIGELGMTYAGEGQIILYANEGGDYMRRVSGD